jgi:hypothetical protein
VVAWLQRGDTRATLHDNAGAFMTTNKWEEIVDTHHGEQFLWWNHVASDEVFV